MSRVLHGIERGIRMWGENSDTAYVDLLHGSGAPGGDSGVQDAAPIGSLYQRYNGYLYQKKTSTNSTADWVRFANLDDVAGFAWRSEKVRAATTDAAPISGSNIDLVVNPFGDDEGTTLVAADFAVDDHIIFDTDGTPKLMRVSAISGDEITVVDAASPMVDNNAFVVESYLPDISDGQEKQAIVVYQNGDIIKIADFNWALANGINLTGGYVATGGTVAAGDTVEVAIAKLDGNQQDLITLSGVAQGSVDLGTFTGDIIPDSQTVKQALQALETYMAAVGIVGVQVTGITTITTVDSVPHATVKAAKWLVEVFEEATPANRKAFEVFALTDGTLVDDTTYAKLKLGANFDLSLSVDISGTDMRLRAASTTAGVTVTARRIEVIATP